MSTTRLANLAIAPLVFIVPLVGVPDRLLHPAPWLGLIAAAAILLSQPEITAKAMVADREDRMSALAIFAGQIGAQFVAILQFGYWLPHRPQVFGVAVVAGIVLVAGGLGLRLWAIRTLGRWFTSTVMVQDGQTVIESGRYRALRHPSYTGALVTALGVTIALASVAGVLLVFLASVPAYIYRIRVEERKLLAELGGPYADYITRTWRLVPFVI